MQLRDPRAPAQIQKISPQSGGDLISGPLLMYEAITMLDLEKISANLSWMGRAWSCLSVYGKEMSRNADMAMDGQVQKTLVAIAICWCYLAHTTQTD